MVAAKHRQGRQSVPDCSRLSEQSNPNSSTVVMSSQPEPKQWSLSSNETITSIEAWENNLNYILSLDSNFADSVLTDESSCARCKRTNTTPLRGFSNDLEFVSYARRRTAAQKVTHLEMMLDQIANFLETQLSKILHLLTVFGKRSDNIMAYS